MRIEAPKSIPPVCCTLRLDRVPREYTVLPAGGKNIMSPKNLLEIHCAKPAESSRVISSGPRAISADNVVELDQLGFMSVDMCKYQC